MIFRRVAFSFLALVVIGAGAALLAFKLLEKKVAANERAPHLQLHPEAASEVVYHTLDGQARQLSASKGKVVYLDLWGTWCLQCVAEMPTVQKLYDHYKGDPQVEFLMVSRLDSPEAVRRYAKRHGYDLPFYVMDDADIPPKMVLHQFPSTFLYAKDGTMVAKHLGAADWSDASVIDFIDRLKKQ